MLGPSSNVPFYPSYERESRERLRRRRDFVIEGSFIPQHSDIETWGSHDCLSLIPKVTPRSPKSGPRIPFNLAKPDL